VSKKWLWQWQRELNVCTTPARAKLALLGWLLINLLVKRRPRQTHPKIVGFEVEKWKSWKIGKNRPKIVPKTGSGFWWQKSSKKVTFLGSKIVPKTGSRFWGYKIVQNHHFLGPESAIWHSPPTNPLFRIPRSRLNAIKFLGCKRSLQPQIVKIGKIVTFLENLDVFGVDFMVPKLEAVFRSIFWQFWTFFDDFGGPGAVSNQNSRFWTFLDPRGVNSFHF